jgi:SAM-dependent methyltransferase
MDMLEHNRAYWDAAVEKGDRWTVPVGADDIARARAGEWTVVLTPHTPVPRAWFPPLAGAQVLGLASAGGQQGPILAAAGAEVTVFDNSPKQLSQDRKVADECELNIATEQGDMRDLSRFRAGSFDLIFHPCSNCFVDDVRRVWLECARILKPGGVLLAGFSNPFNYLWDPLKEKKGEFVVKRSLPYADAELPEDERREAFGADAPLEYSHTLEAQIGGQLEAGLHLVGMFEDDWGGKEVADKYYKSFIATRAIKP